MYNSFYFVALQMGSDLLFDSTISRVRGTSRQYHHLGKENIVRLRIAEQLS